MYKIVFSAYCGTSSVIEETDDKEEARKIIAEFLLERRLDYPVVTLEKGRKWEVLAPEDCALVPDNCGILQLKHVTYECRECDSRYETQEEAYNCCDERYLFDED